MNISDLIIDEEFESVIPPLTDEEFELLKESVLNDGEVYHPLVVWNNIIVDGHHRYKILKEHPEVKYRIKERAFENRYEAISWICLNQLGRRNLNDAQKKMLIGRRYKTEKMARGASDGFRGNQHKKSVKGQNVPLPDDVHITSSRIATEMGTNEKTVRRAEKFVDGVDAAEEVLPGVTKDITSGKIKPKQADVAAIAKAPAEERRQLAENLYKEPTPEEKARNKNKRDLMKAIRMCDATHIPSDTNKITPQDMLMTFESEIEKVISSMDFCLDYFPELLTLPEYVVQVKEIIQPLKDYIKNLEENRYAATL
ncbi:MAG TPA: hypothetical protein OIM00_05060 [Oscillospiraceae bacterium]|nr:hypothetical protein [Oscillospiraceae bacterium]